MAQPLCLSQLPRGGRPGCPLWADSGGPSALMAHSCSHLNHVQSQDTHWPDPWPRRPLRDPPRVLPRTLSTGPGRPFPSAPTVGSAPTTPTPAPAQGAEAALLGVSRRGSGGLCVSLSRRWIGEPIKAVRAGPRAAVSFPRGGPEGGACPAFGGGHWWWACYPACADQASTFLSVNDHKGLTSCCQRSLADLSAPRIEAVRPGLGRGAWNHLRAEEFSRTHPFLLSCSSFLISGKGRVSILDLAWAGLKERWGRGCHEQKLVRPLAEQNGVWVGAEGGAEAWTRGRRGRMHLTISGLTAFWEQESGTVQVSIWGSVVNQVTASPSPGPVLSPCPSCSPLEDPWTHPQGAQLLPLCH